MVLWANITCLSSLTVLQRWRSWMFAGFWKLFVKGGAGGGLSFMVQMTFPSVWRASFRYWCFKAVARSFSKCRRSICSYSILQFQCKCNFRSTSTEAEYWYGGFKFGNSSTGCKLLGHQRFAWCHMQDSCKHDQGENSRRNSQDIQY